MSLLLAYTFNEQSTTPADYSGNKQTGASANLTFTNGQNYGHAASLASNSYIKATPANFNNIGAFSVFIHCHVASLSSNLSGKYYLAYKANSFNILINATGNIQFTMYHTSLYTLTTAAAIPTGWHTFGCVWNGTTMQVYIDGVPDANTLALTGMDAGSADLFIGNDSATDTLNTFNGAIDSIEFRSSALQATDIAALHNSPGGVEITNTPNNFATGDLIADSTLSFKGIVTWVADANTFYFYPTTPIGSAYARVGNIYNTARQPYMEFANDFDGNGNGQLAVKKPIAGWADYMAPASVITFDYRGFTVNGMGTSLQWFSEYQARYSVQNLLTSLYQETLIGGTLQANGSYFTFTYTVNVANNANAKTVYVKFVNQTLLSFALTTGSAATLYVSGKVKVMNSKLQQCSYLVTTNYNGTQAITSGALNGINTTINNKLILQAQGLADNDITATDGEGTVCVVAGE